MNRLTDDEQFGLLLGSALLLASSSLYFAAVRPQQHHLDGLEQAAVCTPRQAAATYQQKRDTYRQTWRNAAHTVGNALDSIGLGAVRPALDDAAAWFATPPAEGSPGSIQAVAITGYAASTVATGDAAAIAASPKTTLTRFSPHLNGLVEVASSSAVELAPAGSLRSLDGNPAVLRIRKVDFFLDTPPFISPLALLAFNQVSPVPIWGTPVEISNRLQQSISRTVAEEPWGVQDARGGSVLPVRHGSASKPSEYMPDTMTGLHSAGEVQYKADNSWSSWPWLSMLLAGERCLRIRDSGLPAGASLTVVGGLRRDENGAFELCAHPDFGFCVPESLQALIDATRGSMRTTRILAGLFAAIGAMAVTASLWDHRYFVQRMFKWATRQRRSRPRWGDPRSHAPERNPLDMLREALRHQAAGGNVDELEVEQGVFLRAELARAAGPGISALEELAVEDDQEVGEEEDHALRCVVCLQRRRCIMALPCRHVCTCIECMVVHTLNRRQEGRGTRCPVCMGNLEWIQRVYL